DHSSEVANEEDDLMTQLLELAQLVDQDGVTKMQVWGSRIEARLDAQRLAGLQALQQLLFQEDFLTAALDQRERLFGRRHLHRLLNNSDGKAGFYLKARTPAHAPIMILVKTACPDADLKP